MAGLPPLYATWLAELLAGPVPDETEATCSDCVMCGAGAEDGRDLRFRVDVKCCTYLPTIPNYLVGRALLDDDPAAAAGRDTVLARIQRGVAVTPLGLGSSLAHRLLYEAGKSDLFGRATALRCPHYLVDRGGQCGMWRHRNAVCATWFCKHVRGAVGQAFWRAVLHLLREVERSLACWAVLELGLEEATLGRLFPLPHSGGPEPLRKGDVDGEPPPDYAALWGAWRGREVELYQACADRVGRLAWRDVAAICGPEVALRARLARDAHVALLDDQLPARARVAPLRVVETRRDAVRVQTYSEYDPIELPKVLYDLLGQFDGGDLDAALERIADEDGIELEPGLVRRLLDFAVLAAVKGE